MTTFVLFSQQRSGTGALTSYLSSHPGVENLTEVLNPYNAEHPDSFFGYWLRHNPAELIQARRSPSEVFVNYLQTVEEKYSGRDILLDIKLNSIRHVVNYWEELPGFTDVGMPWLVNLFYRRRYPILYLHRANHLKRYVSSKVAELTGVYHTHDPDSVPHAKIKVDLADMMDFIVKGELAHTYFSKCFAKFDRSLELRYEALFSENLISTGSKLQISRFFGFNSDAENEPYYVKLGTSRLERVLMNFQEVKAYLKANDRSHYVQTAETDVAWSSPGPPQAQMRGSGSPSAAPKLPA